MCSTKTNIAEKTAVGIKLLIDNILSVRFLDFCHAELVPMVIGIRRNDIYSHAELVSASLPYGKDSDLRRNDVYCHAELVSASLPYGEGSDLRRNDRFCCTDAINRVPTGTIE